MEKSQSIRTGAPQKVINFEVIVMGTCTFGDGSLYLELLGGHQLKKHPVFSDGLWLIQCFTNSFDYHSLVLILTFVFTGSIQACVQSLALSVALRGGFPGPEQSQVQNELYFLIECVSRYIVCPVKVY